jgi:hypothetical protein
MAADKHPEPAQCVWCWRPLCASVECRIAYHNAMFIPAWYEPKRRVLDLEPHS